MARRLTFLTSPISRYLSARFANGGFSVHKIGFDNNQWQLPEPLLLARLRGEAFLYHNFFKVLESKQMLDPVTQIKFYQQLLVDRRFVQQIVERSDLIGYFKFEPHEPENYSELCYGVFCILLWDMISNGDNKIAERLVKGFIEHFAPQLFPKADKQKPNIDTLKNEIAKKLYQSWGIKPQIKESFKTTKEKVEFSLVARIPRYVPVKLLTLSGNRLKPTRLKCCKMTLETLENNTFIIPELEHLTPKKQEAIAPLKSKDV